MLLSCKTILALHLMQPRSRLEYLPPRASLITSDIDHLKRTKSPSLKVHQSKQEVSAGQGMTSISTNTVQKAKLDMVVTSKEQILSRYPDVFEGIQRFPGQLYHIQVDPNVTPKHNPCQPVPIHLKETFRKEIDKMLQAGIIKPVKGATPWLNSSVLVEGKDKSGNPKLHICLNPTNLNKTIV